VASEVAAAPQLDPPEDEQATAVHKVVVPPAGKDKPEGKTKAKKPRKGPAKEPSAEEAPTVAAHPRAARAVARAKGWAGLVGFLAAGYLSMPTSTLAGAGLRALIAGIACYVAVWGGAVFVWRRLVVLEVKAREQELLEQARRAAEERLASGGTGARDGP